MGKISLIVTAVIVALLMLQQAKTMFSPAANQAQPTLDKANQTIQDYQKKIGQSVPNN